MAKTSALPHCQLPGCSNPVEQPSGGGPHKRFCCDAHRLSYWRQTQREAKAAPDPLPVGGDVPALALKGALEQSLQSLEAIVLRTRTTLIELSSLEEAEAIRKEAFAIAEEQVARAQAERAAEERRRQAAESLAEAAAASAREAETQLQEVLQQIEALQAENKQLEQLRHDQAAQAEKSLQAVQRKAEQAGEKLLQEVRSEIAARAKAEARADSAENRVDELKTELATLRGESSKPSPATSKKKGKK